MSNRSQLKRSDKSRKRLHVSQAVIYFNTRDELIKVRLENVAFFEADANYCNIHFTNGAKATILSSLTGIENMIKAQIITDGYYFIRIGKKYIVNQRYIFQINIPRQRLVLTDFISPQVYELAVSKEALKSLKQLFHK